MDELKHGLEWLTEQVDTQEYKTLHQTMSFAEYISAVESNPRLARTAYQRLYDMIMAKGTKQMKKYRKTYTHYNFFDNPKIPIFGLEDTLDKLVKFIRGAAGGYGTEKRILLLHGPVGSSKSTICRLLKRGLEDYSYTDEGAWYSYKWVNLPTGSDGIYTHTEDECPMHDDPLRLIPDSIRNRFLSRLNETLREQSAETDRNALYPIKVDGELNPRCKKFMSELMNRYNGDWNKVVSNHIVVIRKVYSESDRMGIATFQPKDEKNQDATELTGDINYGKLPHYGADSDPRAFNFDGEFCVGNRGVVEFIEMLKLDKAFLYDLLGASQERSIKPKKFAQISVDEVLIGHSVHEDTPIPHLYNGILDVLPISELAELEHGKLQVFSFNEETGKIELSHVNSVFSHDFEGEWVENHQDNDVLVTTPNHSVYKKIDDKVETFYPGDDETSEMFSTKLPGNIVFNYPMTNRWKQFFEMLERKAS